MAGVHDLAMAGERLRAPAPGAGRVERRKARTRAGLLAAARGLFAARGMEHATIAEIAEHADIAIGSFYNYFRTKEELLDALLEEQLAGQLTLLLSRQDKVDDPAEKISVAHRHLVRAAQTDPDWAWLMVRLEVPYRVAWSVLGGVAR
jgi:AcrR family transcriptional regulator